MAQDAPPPTDQPPVPADAQLTDIDEEQPTDLVGLARSFVQRVGGRLDKADERELLALAPLREEAPPGPGEGIPDGEELILEVLIAELRFVDSIFVVKQGTGVLVSLAEITEFIGFAIEVGDDPGRAAGWFIRESNTFELDFNAGRLVIRGEPRVIEEGMLVFIDDDLFLHSSAFEDWFNVQMTVDFRNLVMTLSPRVPLPLQERIARLEKFERTTENQARKPALPFLELPFKLITTPALDISLRGTRFSGQGQDTSTSANYSILGIGELAYATSNFFLTGSQDNPVSGLRLTLSREDPDGAILGPVQATKVEVGDLAAGGFGRGVTFTNSPQGFSNTTSNTTEFVGDIQPDWDVELYHNGVLVGLQQVGEEARYEFRNVRLFVGANEFRLVFFGPQGEMRESRSSIPLTTIGKGAERPIFNVALNQRGRSLYSKPAPGPGQSSAVALSTSVSDQIGNLSVQVNLSIADVKKLTGATLSTGLNFPVFDTRVSTSFGYSVDANALAFGGGVGLAGILPWGDQYSIFTSFPSVNDGFKNLEVGATVAGRIQIAEDSQAPYRVTGGYAQNPSTGTTSGIAVKTGTGFGRLNLSWDNQWEKIDPIIDPTVIQSGGSLSASWSFFPAMVRGGVNYDLMPKLRTTSLNGRLSWSVRRNMNASLQLEHTIATASSRLQGSLSFVAEKFILSPSFTANTKGDLFVFMNIRFSNVYDPRYSQSLFRSQRMSDRGSVVARVFLDANNNGVYDVGELPVPDARVQAAQVNRGANSNEQGFAFLVGLPKNILTDILVLEGSLLDPFWTPAFGGRSIRTRAGSVHYLDFPILETAEIEGKVLVKFPTEPEATPLPRITVRLVNAQGETVDSKVSAFDGFYLFTNVLPGDYHLEVDAEDAEGFRLEAPEPTPLAAEQAVIHVVNLVVTTPNVIGFVGVGAAGDAMVDLGAYDSVTGADVGWLLLQRQFSGLLGGLVRMRLTHPPTPGLPDTSHSVFAGPLTPRQASDVCQRLSAQGQACSVATSVAFTKTAG